MSRITLIIRGGTVVSGGTRRAADVLVSGTRIFRVLPRDAGETLPEADAVLDADGLWVLPGGVDAHVHFGMPLADGTTSLGWRESSEAALLGGTTTVVDFANPDRGESLGSAVDRWLAAAADACLCDYGLHATVVDAGADRLAELPALVARGVSTFKAFLAYKGRLMLSAAELERVMRACAALDARLLVHAEDGDMNAAAEEALLQTGRTGPEWHPAAHPRASEIAAVETALDLARRTGCRLTLVHLSCAESAARLADARRAEEEAGRRDRLCGEACLHHLLLDEGLYRAGYEHALRAVLSPPLRRPEDGVALAAGLADGTVDQLATDHCEFPLAVKTAAARRGFPAIPNGAGGVGERMVLSHSRLVAGGVLSAERWVEVCCERPARLLGLDDRKGRIAPGLHADLVLFDPHAEGVWTPAPSCDPAASLYARLPVRGAVRAVVLRGREVVRGGRLLEPAAPGRFLIRGTA